MMNAYLSIFFNLRYQAKNTPSLSEGVFFCYNQAKTPVAHFKLTQLALLSKPMCCVYRRISSLWGSRSCSLFL